MQTRFDAGGDVEIPQIAAAKGASGGLDAGEFDLFFDPLRAGVEADHFAAVAKGDPESVLAVDGHAIGGAGIGARVPDDTFVFDGTRGWIEVEGTHFFAGSIDVEKGVGCAIPGEAVGVGDGGKFSLNAEIGIQAIESGLGALFEADGSGPEAPVWIALAIVESIVGEMRFGIGDGGALACTGIEKKQAVISSPDPTSAGAWYDGADALSDVPGRFIARGGIKADETVSFDIDVEKMVLVPERAFSPKRDAVANRFRTDHAAHLEQAGCWCKVELEGGCAARSEPWKR